MASRAHHDLLREPTGLLLQQRLGPPPTQRIVHVLVGDDAQHGEDTGAVEDERAKRVAKKEVKL